MKQKLIINNYVAKNTQRSGAGKHIAKNGEGSPRVRQKRQWKKMVHKELNSQGTVEYIKVPCYNSLVKNYKGEFHDK